jgi:hypothetical protein
MIDNESVYHSNAIFAAFANIKIDLSTFNNNNYGTHSSKDEAVNFSLLTGSFLSISITSVLTISNSTFTNGYGESGGCIYLSGNSNLTLSNITFTNCEASAQGGAIYVSNHQLVSIEDCIFDNNQAYSGGNDIYGSSGYITILSSIFFLTNSKSSIQTSYESLTGEFLAFITLTQDDNFESATYGGAIYSLNDNLVSIKSSTFENITHTKSGGAIAIK